MDTDIFKIILLIVAVTVVQILFSLLPKRILRCLPTILCVVGCVVLFVLMQTIKGWEVLVYLALLIYGVIGVGVTLVIFIVGEVVRAVKGKR